MLRPCLLATLLTALLRLTRVEVALRTPEGVGSALLGPRLLRRPRLLLRALKRWARRAVGFTATEIIGAVGIVYVAIQHLVAGRSTIRTARNISRTSVLAGTISAVGR